MTIESFFSSLKIGRTARKTNPDVFDYIERLYNIKRRRSAIGYMRPRVFKMQAQ
jgi:putative transposase